MRITIDATSTLLRSAGVKSYTVHWVRHLQKLAEIQCFPYLRELGPLNHDASMLPLPATLSRLALVFAINHTGPFLLDRVLGGADVFHCSNMTRQVPTRAKLTGTIHDLTGFLMPELHTAGNIRADHNFAERILRRAHGLIAVSENTRQDAIRYLRVPPEQITTIYSGIAEHYFDAQHFDAQPAKRSRPYVLYVGTIEPRKNLDTLLDAWKQLKVEHELVIAGPAGWGSEKTLARIRQEAFYLGYVPETDMPGLIAGATAFVYPSLYEGFGFPVVQAMAAGTPVVTSNTSCLPEIAGEAAVLVDPRSPAEISGGIKRLLESESLRTDLIARGHVRAQRYRWETCAAQSLEFFRRVTSPA